MKKFILIIALFISSPSYADWSYFASTDQMAVYLNNSEVIRAGEIVKAWDLAEFNKPTITGTKAQETYREYDCKRGSSKILKMKTYDKNKKLTDSYSFLPDMHSKPEKGSIGDSLLRFYCR